MARPLVLSLLFAAGLGAAAANAGALKTSLEVTRLAGSGSVCTGRAPAVGQTFRGTVLEVLDGQTLCVAQGPTMMDWVRAKISGAPAKGSRQTLMAASFGQTLSCMTVKIGPSAVEARCILNNVALDRVLASDAMVRAGADWR